MSSKQKANSNSNGKADVKTGRRVSKATGSTPAAGTPRSVGSDDDDFDDDDDTEMPDELKTVFSSSVIFQNVRKFDISSFPYMLPPGIIYSASRHFQPPQKRDFTAMPCKALFSFISHLGFCYLGPQTLFHLSLTVLIILSCCSEA